MPPDTTLALFAREEARSKAPPRSMRRSGRPGAKSSQMTVKRWELAQVGARAGGRMGLRARQRSRRALVEQVGERQQRLLRELETLALEGGGAAASRPRVVTAEAAALRAADSTESAPPTRWPMRSWATRPRAALGL